MLAKVVYHKLADPDHKKLRTHVVDGVLQHVNNGYCSLLEPKSISGGQFAEWITGRNPGTYVAVHYLKLIDFTFGPDWQLARISAHRPARPRRPGRRPDLGLGAAAGRLPPPGRPRGRVRHPHQLGHAGQLPRLRRAGGAVPLRQRRLERPPAEARRRVTVEGRTPGELKNTPNHHYNGTFLEPWGERSQRGYGIEIIERFFEEVAFVEFGGPAAERADGCADAGADLQRPVGRPQHRGDRAGDGGDPGAARGGQAGLRGEGQRPGRRARPLRARAAREPECSTAGGCDAMNDKRRRVAASASSSASTSGTSRRDLGLTLEPGGWVRGRRPARRRAARPGSRSPATNWTRSSRRSDKQRFAFDETGTAIRANQGHSVEVDLQLEPAEPPAVCTTAPAEQHVDGILRDGLRRWRRHHVHLSPDVQTATKVGSRHGKPVVLSSTPRGMRADGHIFLRLRQRRLACRTRPARSTFAADPEGPDRMTAASITPGRAGLQRRPRDAVAAARAARAADLHADPGRPRQAAPASSTGRPKAAGCTTSPPASSSPTSGHNPIAWMKRFAGYMGWPSSRPRTPSATAPPRPPDGYFSALPMTAYNAVTPVEVEASRRLAELLQSRPGGRRLEQVMWAASGSEAIQKALWAALARDRSPADDPRHALRLPRQEGPGRRRHRLRDRPRPRPARAVHQLPDGRVRRRRRCATRPFDPAPYRQELDALLHAVRPQARRAHHRAVPRRRRLVPPAEGVPADCSQQFCRENDIVFILDEVQSNFGRTGDLFAFETYGLEPDIVVLGKGLGNGVPVAAAVGRADVFGGLDYGEGSDTWSANPLCCAAVLATLDEFAARDVLGQCPQGVGGHRGGPGAAEGTAVRGRTSAARRAAWCGASRRRTTPGTTAADWANALVLACYRGERRRRHPPARPAGEEGRPRRAAA